MSYKYVNICNLFVNITTPNRKQPIYSDYQFINFIPSNQTKFCLPMDGSIYISWNKRETWN